MRLHRIAIAQRSATVRSGVLMLLASLACSSAAPASTTLEEPISAAVPAVAAPAAARVSPSFGSLPVSFEPNVGQAPANEKYIVAGADAAAVTATGVVLRGGSKPVTLEFIGASTSASMTGTNELAGKANYLVGDDPSAWKTNVPTYASVRVEQLYPGVDLAWYGKGRSLEFDLVLEAGADPGNVSFKLDGVPAPIPEIGPDGALVAGDVRFERPVAYQEVDEVRKAVPCGYVTNGDGRVGFRLGEYDHLLPLVIDPEIGYTYTFADSSKDISIFGIAVDSTGAAYVAGRTRTEGSGGVLTVAAFVAKLNPEGTALVYSTTISGSAGNEEARDIAVDATGNAFITGFVFSSNFPTTAGAFQTTKGSPNGTQDAFVAKLAPGGDSFVYSSFLGGSGGTSGSRIAIDASGNAFVAGFTQSSNFPTTSPAQGTFGGVRDAFLTKVNAAGSAKTYSTYLGGSQSDTGNDVAVDASGSAYVVGVTTSTNFPVSAGTIQGTSGGGSDGFWAKYDPAGQRVASTYLGGTGFDSANGVAVDAAGNSYLTGETASPEFPLVAPVQSTIAGDRDAFITSLNGSGTATTFSTFYGGTRYDYGTAIALGGTGSIDVVGTTESNDFPAVDPVQSTFGGGVSDAFVIRLGFGTTAGRLELPLPTVTSSSYQGGPGRETGAAVGPNGANGVAVATSQQKDSPQGGHDEAGVTTYTYVGPPAPDLAVTGALAGTYTSNGERYYLIFVLATSTTRCSADMLAPNATFGVVLPAGVRFKGVFASNRDVTVTDRPDVDHAGAVTFTYSKAVPILRPNQEFAAFPSSAYVLVTVEDPQVTSLPVNFFASVSGSLECYYDNNEQTKVLDLLSKGLRLGFGSKTLQVFGYSPEGSGKPVTRMIGDAVPDLNPPHRSELVPGLVGFNVYMSVSPGVQPVEANRIGFIPADQVFFDASDTPSGAFFILTAVSADGESEASNEVGGALPSVSSLKVSGTKLVAKGAGFATDVRVYFADNAFEQAPKLKAGNSKLTQKGLLERGTTIGEFTSSLLIRGSKVLVLFVNGNGNAVATEYMVP